MRRIAAIAVVLLIGVSASAQSSKGEKWTPSKGDWSLGVNINPVAAGGFDYKPSKGEFLGAYISGLADNPSEMYIPGQQLVSIKTKYFISNSTAIKASLGFNGSHLNYKEYVTDDWAKYLDSTSEIQTEDGVIANMGGATIALGIEKSLGKGPLRFVMGFDAIYTIGAGKLTFDYGNDFKTYNSYKPSTIAMTDMTGTGDNLNGYTTSKFGIAYARPAVRNDIGTVQQIGLAANLGLEYFLADHISVGLEACIVPVTFTWQSQSWAVYEGYSATLQKVMTYNKLVSPGSHALTYGTSNFGVNISVSYYF